MATEWEVPVTTSLHRHLCEQPKTHQLTFTRAAEGRWEIPEPCLIVISKAALKKPRRKQTHISSLPQLQGAQSEEAPLVSEREWTEPQYQAHCKKQKQIRRASVPRPLHITWEFGVSKGRQFLPPIHQGLTESETPTLWRGTEKSLGLCLGAQSQANMLRFSAC